MKREWRDLWICSLPVGTREIPCYLSSPDLRPFLARRDARTRRAVAAYYDPTTRAIYVCASEDEDMLPHYLVHELQHAAYDECGAARADFDEERAVRALTPSLLPALKALGLMMPAMPEGWRALQAHARYVRRRAAKEKR